MWGVTVDEVLPPVSAVNMTLADDGARAFASDGSVLRLASQVGVVSWRSLDGKPHNPDGPAIIYDNGMSVWYEHGLLHRVDGPAVVGADGSTQWWREGRLHRVGGPAVVYPDGVRQWWVDGVLVGEKHAPSLGFQ